MSSYDNLAKFYDDVNGEPVERIRQILDTISRYFPDAKNVLELGSGTGAILAGLGSDFNLVGVDLSEQMIDVARRRCPQATFIHGDISSFSSTTKFDVVICVYDTINHLTSIEKWRQLFSNVAGMLSEGGIFIFDVNTIGRFEDLGEVDPWVYEFEENTLIMELDYSRPPLATWYIKVFESLGNATYQLHQEKIEEIALPIQQLRKELEVFSEILVASDSHGGPATDEAHRALFAVRK